MVLVDRDTTGVDQMAPYDMGMEYRRVWLSIPEGARPNWKAVAEQQLDAAGLTSMDHYMEWCDGFCGR